MFVCGVPRPTPGSVAAAAVGVAVRSIRSVAPIGRSPRSGQARVCPVEPVCGVTSGSTGVGAPPGWGLVTTALPAS